MIEIELGVVSDATDVHIVRRYVALLVLEKKCERGKSSPGLRTEWH